MSLTQPHPPTDAAGAGGSILEGAAAGHPDLRRAFTPAPGYLNAATLGLPPRTTRRALDDALGEWQRGDGDPAAYDVLVDQARQLFAGLAHVPPSWVAIGSQVSVTAGMVAAALPAGSRVVCVEGDFSSMVYPFLVQAHRGISVRQVPLHDLADAVADGCDLVSFSLAQSADGSVADAAAVRTAAQQVHALTFCDTTQALGWLDVDASEYDVTVCSAYKPRSTDRRGG